MTLMKQLTPLYSKIVNDEVNSQLICSNGKPTKSNITSEEKEVAKLVKSKGGSIKYKTFASRDIYIELLNEKFHTVFIDEVKMKITCGNLKKGF